MRTAFIAYMPVLHAGYLALIQKVRPTAIFLLSVESLQDVPQELDYLVRKDSIRALSSAQMALAVSELVPPCTLTVQSVCVEDLRSFALLYDAVVMPAEDVSRYVAEKYLSGMRLRFESVFVRWDRDAVHKQESAAAVANAKISHELLDRAFMQQAENMAEGSADWWRQLGGVLVKDGLLLYTACNQHTPHPQAPYAFGDPRSIFKRGIRIECSTAEHAEATLIAEAARQGVSTQGASLYVTTFPCPMCARLVAHTGIAKCYFASGYAVLDGASVMRDKGVELIYVEQ